MALLASADFRSDQGTVSFQPGNQGIHAFERISLEQVAFFWISNILEISGMFRANMLW
jgi:hypothetical protein